MNEKSGWTGWVYFARVYMIIAGFFQIISGLTALYRNEVILAAQGSVWLFDLTTWGWTLLIIGLVVLFSGFAVFSGSILGRTVGVIAATISAIVNFAFIPIYPFWSILAIIIDISVIYALIMHGSKRELYAE